MFQKSNYRPISFKSFLTNNLPQFSTLSNRAKNGIASLLYSASTGRFSHCSGDADVFAIFCHPKKRMFGSAHAFDNANALLGLFILEKKYVKGRYANGYKLTEKAIALLDLYLAARLTAVGNQKHSSATALETEDGKPFRMPPQPIRSRTSSGSNAKYKAHNLPVSIKIDIQNLIAFASAAQNWAKGEPAPPGIEWIHAKYNRIRDSASPGNGHAAAVSRAKRGALQAIQLLDIAVSGSSECPSIPTTYVIGGSGRLYAENHCNLQQCVSEVRKAALKGCYDIDIDNCHWSLLAQLAAKADVQTPHIEYYLNHKDEVRTRLAKSANVSIEDAKEVLISLIYGATLAQSTDIHKNAICEKIGTDALALMRQDKAITELCKEVRVARKAVVKHYRDKSVKSRTGGIVNDVGCTLAGAGITDSQRLAHILLGAESAILRVAIDAYGDCIVLLQHDGFTSTKNIDRNELARIVEQKTGFAVTFSSEELR